MFEIRMAHPAKNALSSELLAWLNAQLDEAGERPILLTGTGDAFSVGLNLKELASLDEPEAMFDFVWRLDALCERLYLHPAPVVAAVNGHAIAGGCVLVQCADHRVGTTDPRTRMGLNEVALGVSFPPKILGLLRQRLPSGQHERLLLCADLFETREALELGMLDELAADAELVASERLVALAAHSAPAYAATKRALRAAATQLSERVEENFRANELGIWTSPEVRARLLSVLKN